MPYLGPLSLLHLALLVGLSRSTARALFTMALPRLLAVAVLAWSNLVLTALALSPLRLLGSPAAYFAASVGLALLARRFFVHACPTPTGSAEPSFAEIARQLRARPSGRLLMIALAVVSLGVALVAISVLPNNWDTLAYRFPRPHFFLSSGAVEHVGEGIDPRINFYPYNSALLYLFLAQYQWPPMAWNFVGVGAWLLCGAAGFHLAILMKASFRGAAVTLYALLTTPIVLCLANSTNDELLAAAPLATALVFMLLAHRHRSPQSMYLALIAAGVGAGVKLHWLWLLPWLGVGVWIVARREGRELLRWGQEKLRPATLAVIASLSILLGGSFLVGNYRATGELQVIPPSFAAGIVNRPFHLGAALQTTGLYTFQLLGAPIVDHARVFGVERGRDAYALANELSMRWLGPRVRQGPPFTHVGYRFRGLVEPDAKVFFEQSLWLGLLPHLALASLVGLLWLRPAGYTLPAYLLAALPAWHVTHCFMVRYSETAGTYYAFAVPFFAAPVGWVWDRARRSCRRTVRMLAASVVVLLASHTLLAGTLLLSNQRRNVLHAFGFPGDDAWSKATIRVSPSLRTLVEEARRVEIPYTHWELLYWNVMRLNPAASYVTGRPDVEADLTLFVLYKSLAENNALPLLPLRAEVADAVRLAGSMNAGHDAVFCAGATCERVCRACEKFLLLPMRLAHEGGRVLVRVGGPPHRDDLEYGETDAALRVRRLGVRTKDAEEWVPLRTIRERPLTLPERSRSTLAIEVSSGAGGAGAVQRTILRVRGSSLHLEAP